MHMSNPVSGGTTDDIDPSQLTLDDLRSVRSRLQGEDDAVSFVRRLTQARLDLVRAEQARRADPGDESLTDELPEILGAHLTGGSARPPRPAEDFSDHPLATEFEAICAAHGAGDLGSLDDGELTALADALADFEHSRSAERRRLFDRIDALSAELVRRYRDGEASVDGLLDGD
jgi:hypothetical protein